MRLLTSLLSASLLVGCGDPSTNDDGPSTDGALYVVATAVSDDTASNTYVALLDSIGDVGELDLGKAREFPGWSDLGVIGDFVLVSSGEAPTVTRFSIDAAGALQQDGVIDFANYVSDANLYSHELISPTKAYLLGEGEIVVWNPTTLEITGTIAVPQLPERDGIKPWLALDRGAVVRGNRLYATVGWNDVDNLDMLPDSRIVVFDTTTDTVVDTLTAPCPDLSIANADDAGNLYFSNWVYSPGATLLYGDSPACVVRIPAGSEALDAWHFAYGEATGHEGAALDNAGDGKLMFSSFLGDPQTYDPQNDWFDWLFGDVWQLQTLDPATGKAAPITGIPMNGGGYYASRFDDTTHVLIPGDGYTTTTIYGLQPDGTARQELHMQGWSTRVFRVR